MIKAFCACSERRTSRCCKISVKKRKFKRVVMNVAGEIFETYKSTLNRFPSTLLGDARKRRKHFCSSTKQFFFNRNRKCFAAILFYYQSGGILRCPNDIMFEVFEEECKFFEIPDDLIDALKAREGIIANLYTTPLCPIHHVDHNAGDTCAQKVWNVLENPETSFMAQTYTVGALVLIFLSIVSACVETLPYFRQMNEKNGSSSMWENPWLLQEFVLNTIFLLEISIKFIVSPCKQSFFTSFLNWFDAMAVFPYFITIMVTRDMVKSIVFLRIVRFVRVIRLCRLSKYSIRLKIIGEVMKLSREDFQLAMIVITSIVILGGSALYSIEEHATEVTSFDSIPNAFWWSLQTITTVGYGDLVPMSIVGRCFAAAFMCIGAITLLLPILSLVTNFMDVYMKNVDKEEIIVD